MVRFGLALAIITMAGTVSANRMNHASKKDFMIAMDEAVAKHNLELKNDNRIANNKSRKEKFYKKLLENAVLVKGTNDKEEPEFMKTKTEADRRELGGDDDFDNRNDDGNNNDDGAYEAGYIDLSGFALKYIGCSQLSSYSDYKAQTNADSVLSKQNFVSFRLCPYDSCFTKSQYGCGYNYGEYLVPMNDYLEAYETYKMEAFEQFCDYCDQCMYFEQYFYGNRNLEENEDEQAAQEQHACKHYDTCVDYSDNCENIENNDVSFECAYSGKDSDGGYLYGAPYCSSDGFTIKTGLFSDEYCTEYVKDSRKDQSNIVTSIDGIIGLNSGECISCRKDDLPWTLPKGYNKNNNNNNNEDEQTTLQFCENLYLESAKCEKHMKDYQGSSTYQIGSLFSYETDTQCLFITNAEKGGFDEYGVVLVPGEERIVDRSVALHTRAGLSRSIRSQLGTFKTCVLIFFIVGCTCLMITAWHLKRRLLWNAKKTQFLKRASEYPTGDVSPSPPPPPAEHPSQSPEDLVELARNEDEEKLAFSQSADIRNDDVDDRILGLRGGSFESGRAFT